MLNKYTFRASADEHSLTILEDGKHIGMVQWHPNRPPRIVLDGDNRVIPFQCIIESIVELRKRGVTLPEDPLMRYAYTMFQPFHGQHFSMGQDLARLELGRALGEELTQEENDTLLRNCR